MPSYKAAWIAFRENSDENERTAAHLLQQHHWPRKASGSLRLIDYGCGDGRMIEAVAQASGGCTVQLVDPDREMLQEAVDRLSRLRPEVVIAPANQRAEALGAHTLLQPDAALGVHLMYLMGKDEREALLRALPIGVPCYFVLDDPTSLFTVLWKRTSQHYHARVIESHELLSGLDTSRYATTRTSFVSRLGNPFSLPPDVRDGVLSLLTYSEYAGFDHDLKAWVDTTVRDRMVDGSVECTCACYEVIRLPRQV